MTKRTQIEAMEDAAERFIEEYEFDDGDGAVHVLTEFERLMIADAIHGLLADDAFCKAARASSEAKAAQDYRAALEIIAQILGPTVPESVTDEGAAYEWRVALNEAQRAIGAAPAQTLPAVDLSNAAAEPYQPWTADSDTTPRGSLKVAAANQHETRGRQSASGPSPAVDLAEFKREALRLALGIRDGQRECEAEFVSHLDKLGGK